MPALMQGSDRSRFTRRFVFHEEPAVLDRLEKIASGAGRSISSEIRSAVRYWIAAFEPEDDGD